MPERARAIESWERLRGLLRENVALLEGIQRDGEQLVTDGRWHADPHALRQWIQGSSGALKIARERREPMGCEAALLQELRPTLQALVDRDPEHPVVQGILALQTEVGHLLSRENAIWARIEQLQCAGSPGEFLFDAEGSNPVVKEKFWESVEREIKKGPDARWSDSTASKDPRPVADRMRAYVLREAKRHRVMLGEYIDPANLDATLGTHDRPELEIDHRNAERLAKSGWSRRARVSKDEADNVPVRGSLPDEILMTRLLSAGHDEKERLYLRLLAHGETKADAQRIAGVKRSTAQTLERRTRRFVSDSG